MPQRKEDHKLKRPNFHGNVNYSNVEGSQPLKSGLLESKLGIIPDGTLLSHQRDLFQEMVPIPDNRELESIKQP